MPRSANSKNITSDKQLISAEKYETLRTDNIRLRVPKGYNAKLKEWLANSPEYSGMSLNAFICQLLEDKTGIDFTVSTSVKESQELRQQRVVRAKDEG